MLVGARVDQELPRAQIVDDRGVGVLHEPAADERRRVIGERAVVRDGAPHGPALRTPDREVVGAERRREVHDAGAVLHRDEVRRDHGVCALDVRVRRLVACPDERGAVEAVSLVPAVPEDVREVHGHDEAIAVPLVDRVLAVRQDRRSLIGGEGPWCGRPHHE